MSLWVTAVNLNDVLWELQPQALWNISYASHINWSLIYVWEAKPAKLPWGKGVVHWNKTEIKLSQIKMQYSCFQQEVNVYISLNIKV